MAANAAGYLLVLNTGDDRVDEFGPTGHFIQTIAKYGAGSGEVHDPQGIAVTSAGAIYVSDAFSSRVEKFVAPDQAVHDGKIVYYTPSGEASVAACRDHPEWAGLVCRTEPAAQPGDVSEGLPSLPLTTVSYNIWDEVETTTEVFGSQTRTKTETYDAAGRAISSEETSSVDASLPRVTNAYNTETGALESQSARPGGEARTTTARDNTLGQMVEYKDATGNVADFRVGPFDTAA